MIGPKDHLWMILYDLHCLGFVITTTKSQQNPPALEGKNRFLKFSVSHAYRVSTQPQSFRAILAKNSAPKGVVEIKDETFTGRASGCPQIAEDFHRQSWQKRRGKGLISQ